MSIDQTIEAGVQDSAAGNQPRYDDYPVDQGILAEIAKETTQNQDAEARKMVEAIEEKKSHDQVADTGKPIEEPISNQELNFRALREEVEKIKQEKEELRRNLDLIRANQQQPEPVRQPERQMFEGMDDSDIPNVKDIRSAWQEREAEYVERIQELQVAQANPDYNEVMERYTTPLLKEKPHLVEGLMGSSNKAMFAYELGKMAQAIRQQPPPTPDIPSKTAQRIVENSRKPGTLSGAGGQGALSKADYYASMSDAEFMSLAGRHLDSI